MPLSYRGISRHESVEQAQRMLQHVGLADEPTGTLDSTTAQNIMDLLLALNRGSQSR